MSIFEHNGVGTFSLKAFPAQISDGISDRKFRWKTIRSDRKVDKNPMENLIGNKIRLKNRISDGKSSGQFLSKMNSDR